MVTPVGAGNFLPGPHGFLFGVRGRCDRGSAAGRTRGWAYSAMGVQAQ
ncbi:hypothetical protein Amir_3455 [Actinosynnema mirum DSM 43827]|uniref:Uncharacterized protein n=1 Tax=Actinosynnema mirum (strain ATCC 29888 / DSM 43827 / JCM 3225 / NBRC 14064 / NCIMB 13271 / NRRL B-12336 / IMRU 3971 / 101) TaxID=446462 RepID=C6WAN3_ACTMD|nr:hypothetical protein Amir_3455 [Actinosynnema mirum DSM 43827]